MVRRPAPLATLMAGAVAAALLKISAFSFVGSTPAAARGGPVARKVGVDYLLRNGPKDADPPLIDTLRASGATHEVTFKKRPFGIIRYAPGSDGTGAVVMELTEKSRYPGDPLGQAATAGVSTGWVVKSINGNHVAGVSFEDIMTTLDDEVMSPQRALSLNLKESGISTAFTDRNRGIDKSYGPVGDGPRVFGEGKKAELPITIVYQEQGAMDGTGAPPRAAGTTAGAPSSRKKRSYPVLGIDI